MVEKKTDSPSKDVSAETPDTAAREVSVTPDSSPARRPRVYETQDETSTYEEYLFGRGVLADGAKGQAWSDTTQGRATIRLFSRGIVGAVAFTLGGRYANKHLRNYDTDTWSKSEPLHWIAKGFDTVLGEPIRFITKTAGNTVGRGEQWADSATRFRTRAYYYNNDVGFRAGRTLGAEMVAISFDFASASVGDATTRNVIQSFDPNVKKPWIVNGKFDLDRWMEASAQATWRIFSKNAGEDWAAALPYVYQMKWQRQAIAKLFPGAKSMFDYGWNGGSYRVNQSGNIVGDYHWAGIVDLQCRFVGYNWYTLMYRDMYDTIGRGLNRWKNNGYQISLNMPEHPIESALGDIGQGLRYVAKSFVKSNLYMQPAVPFFWSFRTPQTKWRASPICSEHPSGYGILTEGQVASPDHMNKFAKDALVPRVKENIAAHDRTWNSSPGRIFQGGTHVKTLKEGERGFFGTFGVTADNYDPYAWKNQKTMISKILNPLGWLSFESGNKLVALADKYWKPDSKSSMWLLGDRNASLASQNVYREMTLRGFSDAAFSYTPYMIAKAEFGLRVDDRPAGGGLGEMDKAIYGAIDSLGALKFNNFGKYVERIGHLITDEAPVHVKSREGAETKKETATADGTIIPEMSKDPSSRIEKSSVVAHHKQALSADVKPADQQGWKSYIAEKRDAAQLHPSHPTVQ